MVERKDVPRSCQEFVNCELPQRLGFWLDQAQRTPEDNQRMAMLAYEAFSLIFPRKWMDRRNWSIKEMSYKLKQKKREGQRLPESFFRDASTIVVLDLLERGLLVNKNLHDINPSEPIFRSTNFRIKSSRKPLARAYEYLAFLGELAGIDQVQLEDHRRMARELME